MKKNGGKLPEKKTPKMKSKFSAKYKDRIEYMQDSVSKKEKKTKKDKMKK